MLYQAFQQQKDAFVERYLKFYNKYKKNPDNQDTVGHLNEISYVLITVFGVTPKQIEALERGGVLWEE